MMPHAYLNPEGIENVADVVRVPPLDAKGNSTHASGARPLADNPYAVDLREVVEGPRGQVSFVGGNVRHAQVPEVSDGRLKPNGLGDHRGSRLKTGRRLRKRRVIHVDNFDHGPSEQEGWELGEQFVAPPQCADARGPEHLVPREREKVDAELRDIDRHVRCGLACVEHCKGTDIAGTRHESGNRIDRAKHIGLMRESENLRAFIQQRINIGEVELEIVRQRDVAKRRARAAGKLLPRDEVRMVLHLGHENLIAFVHA